MDTGMASVYWLVGMTLMVFLSGCGGGNGVVLTGSTKPSTLIQQTGQFGSLQFSLVTDKTSCARGEPVQLTFTVKNVGAQALESSITRGFDAKVIQRRQLIWQLSKTEGTGGAGTPLSLGPGKSRTFRFTWSQKNLQGNLVRPGKYTIKAWFDANRIDEVDILPGEQESKLAAAPVKFKIKR